MSRIFSILFVASLSGLTLNPAWAQNGTLAIPQALPPAPPAPSAAQAPGNEPNIQVKLYRLHNTQASRVSDELLAIFARQNIRVATDEKINAVVVASPAGIQDIVSALIPRLDVAGAAPNGVSEAPRVAVGVPNLPPPPGSVTPGTASVPLSRSRYDTAVKAVDRLLADKGALGPGSKVAVLKVSPETAKALEAIMQTQSSPRAESGQVPPPVTSDTPAGASENTTGQVRTFRVSHNNLSSISKALESISARGSGHGVVVITPPEKSTSNTNQEKPDATYH